MGSCGELDEDRLFGYAQPLPYQRERAWAGPSAIIFQCSLENATATPYGVVVRKLFKCWPCPASDCSNCPNGAAHRGNTLSAHFWRLQSGSLCWGRNREASQCLCPQRLLRRQSNRLDSVVLLSSRALDSTLGAVRRGTMKAFRTALPQILNTGRHVL